MNELVYSGFGAEASDTAIRAVATTRPLWLLRPLPLSQVSPHAYGRINGSGGGMESLASACLGVISQNIHTYDPNTLTALPPHLASRVMRRVCDDRKFVPLARRRPDDATLWTFIAFSDTETVEKHMRSHTVQLPVGPTLAALPPSRDRAGIGAVHPIVAAPYLFNRLECADRFAFLTTLQLDGRDAALTDDNVGALRHATHLTALWTRGWMGLTDVGIRTLSMSLVAPNDAEDAQGLWRLRAWWLTGCMGVGDRSMQSFAKWPGLVLLDVRETSCTEVAMDIYNRANDSLWGGHQPPFQHVNDGLRGLFANDDPDAMLDKLCETLIKSDLPVDDAHPDGRYLSLNLVSCNEPPADEFLPEPKSKAPKLFDPASLSTGGTYKTGLGQVYGAGTQYMEDEARGKRDAVKLALELQAEDLHIADCIARGETPPERRFDREYREKKAARKKFWTDMDRDAKKQKTADRNFKKRVLDWATNPDSRMSSDQVWQKKPIYPTTRNALGQEWLVSTKVFKDKASDAEAHSKQFVKGVRAQWHREMGDGTAGNASAMLVRLVRHDWETMRPGAAAAPDIGEVRARRRAGDHEGIADMLLSTFGAYTPEDVKPTASEPSATQLSVPSSQPDSQLQPTQARGFNPFRAAKPSSSGITKLGAHVCPEAAPIKEEPRAPLPKATSGVTALGRSSGVTPLGRGSGITPLGKSGVTPLGRTSSGVTPLGKTKSGSGITPLGRSSSQATPRSQPKATSQSAKPKAKPASKTAPKAASQGTQTKLTFFAKKK